MMDAPVALGPDGFPVVTGQTYRFVAWLANAAFGWPWNSPGTSDLTAAVRAALPDASVLMPWDALPTDWPKETVGMPGNAFFLRGEGTWKGDGGALSPTLPVAGSTEPLHVAAVWTHPIQPTPTPKPTPDVAPTPVPSAQPPAAVPTSKMPATPPPAASDSRVPSATPAPWTAQRRKRPGAGTKVLLGAGALFGLALVFSQSTRRKRAA